MALPLSWYRFSILLLLLFSEAYGDRNFSRAAVKSCLRSVRLLYSSNLVADRWFIDGDASLPSGRLSYNDYFFHLAQGKSFEEWAKERRGAGKTTHALDLFGSARFTDQPKLFDSLTGVRYKPLIDSPPAAYKKLPAGQREELAGDLLLDSTWRDLDRSMKERKIKGFDLVFIRPFGPLGLLAQVAQQGKAERKTMLEVGVRVVERAFERLSPEEGTLYLQMDSRLSATFEFKAWLKKLKGAGITYEFMDKPSKENENSVDQAIKLVRKGDQTLPH